MNPSSEALEARITDGTGVYVNAGVDPRLYSSELAEEIRRHECDPFELSAVVMAPGLPGFSEGDVITGFCVAKSDGRWLVYRPQEDEFYAFWGLHQDDLGAHGVFGNPLYCWSA
jgi:hypothetical protein